MFICTTWHQPNFFLEYLNIWIFLTSLRHSLTILNYSIPIYALDIICLKKQIKQIFRNIARRSGKRTRRQRDIESAKQISCIQEIERLYIGNRTVGDEYGLGCQCMTEEDGMYSALISTTLLHNSHFFLHILQVHSGTPWMGLKSQMKVTIGQIWPSCNSLDLSYRNCKKKCTQPPYGNLYSPLVAVFLLQECFCAGASFISLHTNYKGWTGYQIGRIYGQWITWNSAGYRRALGFYIQSDTL